MDQTTALTKSDDPLHRYSRSHACMLLTLDIFWYGCRKIGKQEAGKMDELTNTSIYQTFSYQIEDDSSGLSNKKCSIFVLSL